MKSLLILGALVLSLVTAVEARPRPTEDTSWKDLGRDSRVVFSLPQFQLSYGYFIRAGGVCIDGEMLRSIRTYKKCVETRGRNDRCVKYQTVRPSKPMTGTRSVCVRHRGGDNGDCAEYRDIPYSIDSNYEVSVYQRIGRQGDDNQGRLLFKKDFTLATCN
ncbi:MAG: hypothetical protein ACJAT2_002464 [Bacteriovoracaceae bacterium]|jgi:hypothetical protein